MLRIFTYLNIFLHILKIQTLIMLKLLFHLPPHPNHFSKNQSLSYLYILISFIKMICKYKKGSSSCSKQQLAMFRRLQSHYTTTLLFHQLPHLNLLQKNQSLRQVWILYLLKTILVERHQIVEHSIIVTKIVIVPALQEMKCLKQQSMR